jgi:hypothetical protein
MKFSRAISRIRWFSFVENKVSKTISVLVLRVVELNHLTRLIARENFIILTRRESIKSYKFCILIFLNFQFCLVFEILALE